MKSKQVNLFDFDQTIFTLDIDWNKLKDSFNHILQLEGIETKGNLLDNYFYIKKNCNQDIIDEVNKTLYYQETLNIENTTLMTGIIEKLNKKPYIIVSHNQTQTISDHISYFKLPRPIAIFGKDKLHYPKPNSIQICNFLKSNKFSLEETIMHGDSEYDRLFAINLGVKFIHV